ncbi:MAG: hypothetical protein MZV70_01515 [Desulfobacterales bacterium]|nr:hypothetical protein [Desulfobacterales bacterium]
MSISRQLKSKDGNIISLNKIGIIYNIEHKDALSVVEKLENVLNSYGFACSKKQINPASVGNHNHLDKNISLAIVVGGDGTLLSASGLRPFKYSSVWHKHWQIRLSFSTKRR